MNKSDFKVGDHVKIASEHPDATLKSRTGIIVGVPNKDRGEYLVKIEVGPIAGRSVPVNGYYIKLD